jgi:hypothetical protein
LKDDYSADQIFTTAFYIIVVAIVSQIISMRFFENWWFWIGFSATIAASVIGIRRFNMRTIETLESLFIAMQPVLFLFFSYRFYGSKNIFELVMAVVILFLFISFYVLDKHYKKFSWYKSGRIGFSGFMVTALLFLIRAVVASGNADVLSFSGKYEVVLSAAVSFLLFLEIYNLSRN